MEHPMARFCSTQTATVLVGRPQARAYSLHNGLAGDNAGSGSMSRRWVLRALIVGTSGKKLNGESTLS
jgi:hypothetical protein